VVAPGAMVTFTVTPNAGFTASVSGSCGGTLTGTTFVTNAVVADCAVSANFAPQLALVSVKSRKLHAATPQYLTVNIGQGEPLSVEPRLIGAAHTLIFEFNTPISAEGAVTVTDVSAVAVGNASVQRSGSTVVVTLANIPDSQRVNISLLGVNGNPVTFAASMGFLVGDVNGTGSVRASDISAIKANLSQPVNTATYKFDLDADGFITNKDLSAAKARSGTVIP
jgi:hypothetical protein